MATTHDHCIKFAGIYCHDRDKALKFWTTLLGFIITTDYNDGKFWWLEVKPPQGNTVIAICAPVPSIEHTKVGGHSTIVFACDDVPKTYEELSAKGVHFTKQPTQEGYGWSANYEDEEGNVFGLAGV